MNVEVIYTSDIYKQNKLAYAMPGDAGIDLRATEDFVLLPGECRPIDLGVRISIKGQQAVAIMVPRSGLGKKGLVLGNLVGIIDSGYQGQLVALAWNRLDNPGFSVDEIRDNSVKIVKGERLCQLIFLPFITAKFTEVETFSLTTERGEGGFGSTGVK